MEDRASVLERCKVLEPKTNVKPPPLVRQHSKQGSAFLTSDVVTCPYCSIKGHLIQYCPKFLGCDVSKRIAEARRLMFCIICLKRGHFSNNCKSKGCEICKKKHHTALHLASNASTDSPQTPKSPSTPGTSGTSASSLAARDNSGPGIIGTVLVKLGTENGHQVLCRALLDQGSTRNFITTNTVQILNPQRSREMFSVDGIGSSSVTSKGACTVTLSSRFDDAPRYKIYCLIIPRITGSQPASRINTSEWQIPEEFDLADPNFDKPQGVDLLLGLEVFWKIKDHQGTSTSSW